MADEFVPREDMHRKMVDAHMRRTSDHPAIADVTATAIVDAAEVGATYAQAEVNALQAELVAINARLALAVGTVNEVLIVLRDAELIPAT